MDFNKVEQLVAVTTSIVGTIGIVYKVFKKPEDDYIKYIDRYYLKVLEPLIQKVVKNNSLLEEECMMFIDEEYHCIPTYINYMIHLVNHESTRYTWEDIKKVFVIDYFLNRPGANNSFIKGLGSVERKVSYIANIVLIICLVGLIGGGTMMGAFGVISIGLFITGKIGMLTVIRYIAVAILLIVTAIVLTKNLELSGEETYPKSINRIEKIIKNRINTYNRLDKEYKKYNKGLKSNVSDMLFLSINKVEGNIKD